jgi:hypothetical protein
LPFLGKPAAAPGRGFVNEQPWPGERMPAKGGQFAASLL